MCFHSTVIMTFEFENCDVAVFGGRQGWVLVLI